MLDDPDRPPADDSMTATPVDGESSDGSSEGLRTPSTVRSHSPSPLRSRTPSPSPAPPRRVSFAVAPAEVLHLDGLSSQVGEAFMAARHRAASASATCSVADVQHGSLAWRAAIAHGSVITQPAAVSHGFIVGQSSPTGQFAPLASQAAPSVHQYAVPQVHPFEADPGLRLPVRLREATHNNGHLSGSIPRSARSPWQSPPGTWASTPGRSCLSPQSSPTQPPQQLQPPPPPQFAPPPPPPQLRPQQRQQQQQHQQQRRQQQRLLQQLL